MSVGTIAIPLTKELQKEYRETRRKVNLKLKEILEKYFPGLESSHIHYHMRTAQLSSEKELGTPFSKRLRCILFLSIARAVGGVPEEKALEAACAIEMFHMASLAIDDWQDGDQERNGQKALWLRYGPNLALNAAILLVAAGHAILVEQYPEAAIRMRAASIVMASGQEMDLHAQDFWDEGIERYWRIINGKTASFLGTICELATFNRCSKEEAEAIRDFGLALGVLLQLADDFDDICDRQDLDPSNVAHFLIRKGNDKELTPKLRLELQEIYHRCCTNTREKLAKTILPRKLKDDMGALIEHLYGRYVDLKTSG